MSPRLLLGLAAALVVALLVGLWAMMDVAPTSADVPAAKPTPARTGAIVASSGGAPQVAPAAPALPHAPAPSRPVQASDEVAPTPAAAPPKDPKIERIDAERRWMNAEILATEQAVLDCVGKGKLDGYVTIPFRIVRKADKVIVDAQPADITTLTDPAMGECLRTATAGMTFDSLPAGVETVSSYRKIIFKQGALVEDWLGPHETTASR